MKYIIPPLFAFALISCNQQTDKTQMLQKQIDSLQHELSNTYKPGFGEFMSGIQVHQIKL